MLYGFTHSQLGTSLPSSIQNYLFSILALVDFSLFYKLLLKVQIKIAAQLSIHCFLSANFHTHSLSLTPSVTGASHPCSFILPCNTLFAKPLLCSPRESIITFVSPSKHPSTTPLNFQSLQVDSTWVPFEMDASSPISLQQTPHQDYSVSEASPKPYKKSFVTSLMEAAALRTPSFKEDTYFISHLKNSEKKALQELRDKLSVSYGSDATSECSMWGIPLLSNDEKADVILLKFLRARDFRVQDSLHMLEKCLSWRKEFGADDVVEEDLGFKELEGVVAYMHGYDREGHPVCYNAYGVFKDKEMYERIFGDEEKLKKFLRWRVQVLERGISLLHFKPGGVNSIIQVTDLKDMPKRELRVASNQILSLFQDNYPEMVARKVINDTLFLIVYNFFFMFNNLMIY